MKYRVLYDELVCRTTYTCIKCIHHVTSSQHISAHRMCHHQGVFVVVFITLSNVLLYDSGPFDCVNHNNYEDSMMMACVV